MYVAHCMEVVGDNRLIVSGRLGDEEHLVELRLDTGQQVRDVLLGAGLRGGRTVGIAQVTVEGRPCVALSVW